MALNPLGNVLRFGFTPRGAAPAGGSTDFRHDTRIIYGLSHQIVTFARPTFGTVGAGITGSLATTEGQDTAAFSDGSVSGALAATEAGDTASFQSFVPDAIDMHDGGSSKYHKYWKGLQDKEDEKRRKREALEAGEDEVEESIEAIIAEIVQPASPKVVDVVEVVEAAAPIIDRTKERRAREERLVLEMIRQDEERLMKLLESAFEVMQ